MTDPTPTRAEVEAFRPEAIIPSSDTVILPKSQFKRWCENYQASLRAMEARHFAEEAALRERAEAAERELARVRQLAWDAQGKADRDASLLTAARRAEAAAWNDAIEAAAKLATWHSDRLVQDIRALRRAAPAPSDGLREALVNLEKAASEVSRYGAQTGSQWSRLSVALLKARYALSASPEQTKENQK